jgi:serine protease Do
VWRRGAMREISVVIGEFEAEQTAARGRTAEKEKKPAATRHWGMQVADLTDAQRRELKLKGGVRVVSVSDPAARAGLREGDIITAIANTEVGNVAEFEAVSGRFDKNRPVNVLFRRGEWAQYTLIRPLR